MLQESCAQPEVAIFYLGGCGPEYLQKNSEIYSEYIYSLSRNQDPAPRLLYCFFTAPLFFLRSFPSLISSCLNLPFGIQGRSWQLESCLQETGDLKGLQAQGPQRAPLGFTLFLRDALER